jgi:hypothetical protein
VEGWVFEPSGSTLPSCLFRGGGASTPDTLLQAPRTRLFSLPLTSSDVLSLTNETQERMNYLLAAVSFTTWPKPGAVLHRAE